MKKRAIYTMSILIFIHTSYGCGGVWMAHENNYAVLSTNKSINENLVEYMMSYLQEDFEKRGLTLKEKYKETYPGDWWVMKFQIASAIEYDQNYYRDPSICIRPIGENEVQISYRIYKVESWFGADKLDDRNNVISQIKEELPQAISKQTGTKINFNFISEEIAKSGNCRVW